MRRGVRHAYELGRINRAAPAAGVIVALTAFTMARHGATPLAILLASATFVVNVLVTSWSAAGERGARVGSFASALTTLVAEGAGLLSRHPSRSLFCLSCAVGGLVSTLAITLLAPHVRPYRLYWVAAFAIVSLMATLTFANVGFVGVAYFFTGLVLTGVVVAMVQRTWPQ